MDITDIYRIFNPNTKEYTFYSTTHESLSKIGHVLGHKLSHNKFRKTETIP